MSDIKIDAVSFYSKISKLYNTWKQQVSNTPNDFWKTFKDIDAFVVVMGKVQDDPVRPLTSDFL